MEPEPLPSPSISEPSGSFLPPPLSSLQEGMGRRQGTRILCRTVVWKIKKVERTVEAIWSHTFILRSLVPQLWLAVVVAEEKVCAPGEGGIPVVRGYCFQGHVLTEPCLHLARAQVGILQVPALPPPAPSPSSVSDKPFWYA